MKKHFSSAVCMAALLLVAGAAADVTFSPAIAQDAQVSFDTFHDQLAPYGDWVYSDRWGEVWIPTNVSDDFHPYGTKGHWVDTDQYGWTWASDYEWGDIPFHYGRWVNDPDDGWMWVPGYVWSPGWVAWRHNGQYTGWMPLPPDDAFMGHARPGVSVGINIGGVSVSFGSEGDDYGYSRWYGSGYGQDRYAQNWTFIGTGHLADRDYSRYQAPRNNYGTLVRDTTDATHYTVKNNYIVNKSVDPRAVQKAGGHVQTMKIEQVVKRPQFITRADAGVQIQQRARMDRPRGTGFANTAPKPAAAVVQSLSTKAPPLHGGHAAMHLFTRDTVAKAPLAPSAATSGSAMHAGGKPDEQMQGHGMSPSMSGPSMSGTAKGAEQDRHDHTATPGMSGPGMAGPATTTTEPRHEMHGHAAAPGMSGPGMATPAPATTEPKRDNHDRATPPAMSGPGMTGPATTTEPKHEKQPNQMAPSVSGPAPAEPKHEEHTRAPVREPSVTPPSHPGTEHTAAPPAESKADKESHKKHEKPDDTGTPH